MTSAPKTLADDLRSRTDEQLVDLLRARPDLAHPAPRDMTALTTRATTTGSLTRCLDNLNAIETAVLVCADSGKLSRKEWTDRVTKYASHFSKKDVESALDRIHSLALIWGSSDGLVPVSALHGMVHATWDPAADVPALPKKPKTKPTLTADPDASVAVSRVLDALGEIADAWERVPGNVVRSGALSAKEIARLTALTDLSTEDLSMVVELAVASRLAHPSLHVHNIIDEWRLQSSGQQWVALVDAWTHLPRIINSDKPLDSSSDAGTTSSLRRQMLQVLKELPANAALSIDELIALINFRFPRRSSDLRTQHMREIWGEAEFLGIVAHNMVSSPAKLWLDGETKKAIAAMDSLLAEDGRAVIQADFTITVLGRLPESVRHRVRRLADVESRGFGAIYRMNRTSVARALDEQETDASIIEFLTTLSGAELPQSVEHLVLDTARFHKPTPSEPARAAEESEAPVHRTSLRDEATLARIVRGLRGAEQVSVPELPPSLPTMAPANVSTDLRVCLDQQRTAYVQYAESDGSFSVVHVEPVRMASGELTAFDLHSDRMRTLALSRINSVKMGPEPGHQVAPV